MEKERKLTYQVFERKRQTRCIINLQNRIGNLEFTAQAL